MQKILVTGGAGFIGSHVLKELSDRGYFSVILDNLSSGKLQNLGQIEKETYTFIEGDIRDTTLINKIFSENKIESVIHLAAIPFVMDSIEKPALTHDTNVNGTLNILEACRKHAVSTFIFAGSCAVYGNTDKIPVAESHPLNPISPYALQKMVGEQYARLYSELYGLNTICFRFFNIFGERQNPDSPYSGVISRFFKDIREKNAITVFGDGQQTRDFVYAGDLAVIICDAITDTNFYNKIINLGSGKETSLNDLIDSFKLTHDSLFKINFLQQRPGDIRRSCADNSQLSSIKQYTFKTFKEMLDKLF